MKKLEFSTSKGEFIIAEIDSFDLGVMTGLYEYLGRMESISDHVIEDIIGKKDLIKSLGILFENPLGEEPENFATPYTDFYTIAKRSAKHSQWKQFEDKVWDKSKTILFKKI